MTIREAIKRINTLPVGHRDRIYAEYWMDKQVKSVLAIDNTIDMVAVMLNFGIALRPGVRRDKWIAQKFMTAGMKNWSMYSDTIVESDSPLRAVQASALLAVELLGI